MEFGARSLINGPSQAARLVHDGPSWSADCDIYSSRQSQQSEMKMHQLPRIKSKQFTITSKLSQMVVFLSSGSGSRGQRQSKAPTAHLAKVELGKFQVEKLSLLPFPADPENKFQEEVPLPLFFPHRCLQEHGRSSH